MILDGEALFSINLSLKVAFISSIVVFVLGLPVAFFLSVKRFPFKSLIDAIVTLPLVFPPTVTGYILILIFGRKTALGSFLSKLSIDFIFNWKGAVLASSVAAFPLFVKTAKASFESVDENLIKASYTLGKGEITTFLKVILPLSKRGVVAGIVLSFARALGEFGATLMIAGNIPFKTNTVPVEIYTAVSSGEFDKANLLTVFVALISIVVIFSVNKLTEGKDA